MDLDISGRIASSPAVTRDGELVAIAAHLRDAIGAPQILVNAAETSR